MEPRISSRLSSAAKMSHTISRENRTQRFGEFKLGATLGQGEFGKVKLAVRTNGKLPEHVAIKLIRKDVARKHKPNWEVKVFREINALRVLTHPHIVRLDDVLQDEKYIGIVLHYAPGGELFDHILANRFLKEPEARRLFAQLISGVGYMHSKGIVHRDLKLENLLLDQNKNVIITDFGFANSFTPQSKLSASPTPSLKNLKNDKVASETAQVAALLASASIEPPPDFFKTSCGSPCYAAPELVVSDSKYIGRKVDVWSCGVILYAMLAGYLPFDDDPANPDGDNITQLYKYITTTRLTFPDNIQPKARQLLRKILVPDPSQRASLEHVCRDDWLSMYESFLTMKPEEFDKQYTAQRLPKPAVSLNQSHLTRSQSVQATYHVATERQIPSSHSSTALSAAQIASTNATPLVAIAPPPSVPSRHSRHASVNYDSANPSYNRRHSVQAGYTKPVAHARAAVRRTEDIQALNVPKAPVGPREQLQKDNKDTSKTIISETTTDKHVSRISPPDTPLSSPEITPTDIPTNSRARSSSYMPPPSLPTPPNSAPTSTPTLGASMLKQASPRLPAARKPRPTSFQPSSRPYGYGSSYSITSDQLLQVDTADATNHLPMSSPQVGVNHDPTSPGEISKPSSFSSTHALEPALSRDSGRSSKLGRTTPAVTPPIVQEEFETSLVEAASASKTAENKEIVNDSSNDRNSDLAVPVNRVSNSSRLVSLPPPPPPKNHRKAPSMSYGDKLFGRFLGRADPLPAPTSHSSAPPVKSQHRRNHSVVPIGSTPVSEVPQDRKRFSLLSFYSSSNSSSSSVIQPHVSARSASQVAREIVTGQTENGFASQTVYSNTTTTSVPQSPASTVKLKSPHNSNHGTPHNSPKIGSRKISSKPAGDRRILEPPAVERNNSMDQQLNRNSDGPGHNEKSRTSIQVHTAPLVQLGRQGKEQSATRKVVEFFRRRRA